jgi:acyl-CoA oxidase
MILYFLAVGGIETTATFDKGSDEFVIHSPTISSAKFWPGALGFTASHAIVMARLIVDGKDLGVHPFMVNLRSMEDYKPVKGVELGDIG